MYPLWKLVCRFLNVLEVELLYDPSIAHIDISQRNSREYTIEVLIYPYFYPFTEGKLLNEPRWSLNG